MKPIITASVPTWTLLPRPANPPVPSEAKGNNRSVPVPDKDREVSLSPNFDPDADFVLTSPSTVCLSSHDFNRLSKQGIPPELSATTRGTTLRTGDSRRSLGVRLRPRPKYRAIVFVSPYSSVCLQRQDTPRRGLASSLRGHSSSTDPSRAVPPSDAPSPFTPCLPPPPARCAFEPPQIALESEVAPETPSGFLEPFAKLSVTSPEEESPFAPLLLPDFLTDTP
jgi:hypothetical protein